MNPASLSLRDRWWYALKPASWPKLLVPALLGQAVGVAVSGTVSLGALLAGFAFTVLHLSFVVLLNDWGDQEVDALKRRIFGDACSPKTIVDDILESRSVLLAGLGAGCAALGVAIAAELWLGRSGLTYGALVCLALFWAYTLPPLRLNYRGGGELLEMVGVGFALPWWNAYLQCGESHPGGVVVLPAFALLALSSALASGLSDEHSDRLGGKRTFTVMFGPASVRQAVEGLVLGGMVVWALLPFLAPHYASSWMVMPAIVVMAIEFRDLKVAGQSPDVGTYRGITTFKHHLHQCIWRGGVCLSLTVAIGAALLGGIGWATPW